VWDVAGRCNASQDTQDVWDEGDVLLASGRNADGSEAASVFADAYSAGRMAKGIIVSTLFYGAEFLEPNITMPNKMATFMNRVQRWIPNCFYSTNTVVQSAEACLMPTNLYMRKNSGLHSERPVHQTHRTPECQSRIRTQPSYHTTHQAQLNAASKTREAPDAAHKTLAAPDAAPKTLDPPDAAPNTQDAT